MCLHQTLCSDKTYCFCINFSVSEYFTLTCTNKNTWIKKCAWSDKKFIFYQMAFYKISFKGKVDMSAIGLLVWGQLWPPACRWQRVSRDRSLSRLLALSFWGLLGCRSFRDVLLPRLPANFGSCLKMKQDIKMKSSDQESLLF